MTTQLMSFLVEDSDKQKTLYEHRIFAVSYEPLWQGVRLKCNFKSLEGCRASLVILESYVSRVPRDNPEELSWRLWRVKNLLSAIRWNQLNFIGARTVSRDTYSMAREFQSRIQERLNTVGQPTKWDWSITRRNCTALWNTEEGSQLLIHLYKDFTWNKLHKGAKPELRYFLSIIEETNPNVY